MKKRLFSIFLVACMTFFAILGLTACKKEEKPTVSQKLTAPVVTLTGNTARWEENSNADKFEISVNGNLSYVENTVTSKTLTNGQTLKVRAVGNGATYLTSDWSNSVTYTESQVTPKPTQLTAPTVTVSSTGLASWTSPNASSYVYKINGGAETPTTATSLQLSNGQSIAVKAIGDGVNYTDSNYSSPKTYVAGSTTPTSAPTYLGITASVEKPTSSDIPSNLSNLLTFNSGRSYFEELLEEYYSNGDNSLGESLPKTGNYEIYSSAGKSVYVQIWLNNPDQNTILSLKLNDIKYQTGGALQSFFIENSGTYLNCVYVAVTVPNGSYGEISYTVTEIEYVEGSNVNQDGKAVLIDEEKDTVTIGLSYQSYPYANGVDINVGCNGASVNVLVADEGNLITAKGYWLRAVILDGNGVIQQKTLSPNVQEEVSFTSLIEENDYTLVIFYFGDKNDGKDLTYNIIYNETFTTNPVVTVEEFLCGGELYAENGKNGAKVSVFAYTAYDANAYFDRVEIYDGETLVLTDGEFEGYAEYCELNSKTEYTVKIYYSSEENGYSERIKEFNVTTPAYDLPDFDAYDSDKNVVVGKHAIFGFSVEKYTDLKYYDVIIRGYEQNDEYFAPFIVEMLDDPTLLEDLRLQADRNYMRPGGYVWEAQHYMEIYLTYLQAWEHKENVGYTDGKWREIASSTSQYVYQLSETDGSIFVANDGDFVYNYYAVLRDYFSNEHFDYNDLRLDIYLRVDLGDGEGVREISAYSANPYFNEIGDDYYGFEITEDENVKNGYTLTETDMDYKAMYVHKLALYQNEEFICYVPFNSLDVTSVDMDEWLDEWIAKLKCEIPDANESEMVEKVGTDKISEIFNGLWFEEEFGNDTVVDENGVVGSVGGTNKLGNQRERELLTALSDFGADKLLTLFKEKTQENKTLETFIAESKNSVIISVLNDFRSQFTITEQNAYAIYSAIDGVYDVYDQLKNSYEELIRNEYANKEIVDRIESIQAISFDFVVGTDLAPAGDYDLYVLCRSLLTNYDGDDCNDPYAHNIRIKRDLSTPKNIRVEERRLIWDEVEGADEYCVYVNGEYRFNTWENWYENYGDIQDGDTVRIMAIGNYAYDSELSEEYTFVRPKLGKPSATVTGYTITWNEVENANKYVYSINGVEQETYGTSIYVRQNAVVRIKAVDNDGIYSDSDWISVTVSVSSSDKEK